MRYPLNKIVGNTYRHVEVSNNLMLAKERQSFQANKRRNRPLRCKMAQKIMLSSPNINLTNVNKKLKPRWLGLFPNTQVNYQRNNHTPNLSSTSDIHHIHKTFQIGLLEPYCENNQHEFPHCHYSQPGPGKNDRYEVEKAVNFKFSYPASEPPYQIRYKGYLLSQYQWIHSDEIDKEVKFRFSQEEDLKPTFQRRRSHKGRLGPRKRSETVSEIQGERDRVIQSIMRSSAVRFEQPVADQLFNLFINGQETTQD